MTKGEASRSFTPQSQTGRSESEFEIQQPFWNFSIYNYVVEELTQSSRKHEEAMSTTDSSDESYQFKNRVYTFIAIPKYLESFMLYGWLQCLDHMLLVYTFLPIRCFLSIISFLLIQLSSFMRLPNFRHNFHKKNSFSLDLFTKPHELRDLIKFSLIIICTGIMCHIDTSVVYHEIRTQSIMKLYIFFNLLELLDKLLSSVCQDALDDILLTVSLNHPEKFKRFASLLPPNNFSRIKAFLLQYIFALICIFGHCMLLLGQVTTLNVAFNTHQWSLLTVLISNNFVELKGNVFKKLGKTNLFQITCADIRERFHYSIWIGIVIIRNISTNSWNIDYIVELLFNGFCLFFAEIIVDWVKHAFITKFNFIPANVYQEYQVSIAYDMLKLRQGQHNGDYLEVLSRRMGLTPIPLACLINLMIYTTIGSQRMLIFIPLTIFTLFIVKILTNLILLNKAFQIVQKYIKTKLDEQNHASALPNKVRIGGDHNLNNQNVQFEEKAQHQNCKNIMQTEAQTMSHNNQQIDHGKRVHSDSFCAISPRELLRFKGHDLKRSASPSGSRMCRHFRQSSPIRDKTPGPINFPSSPSPPSSISANPQYHSYNHIPLSVNNSGLHLRSRHSSTRGATHSNSTQNDYFDFDESRINEIFRDYPNPDGFSSDEFNENVEKDDCRSNDNHQVGQADTKSEGDKQSCVNGPGEDSTRANFEDESSFLSSSFVKQPLADIDRYQMHGGQIS